MTIGQAMRMRDLAVLAHLGLPETLTAQPSGRTTIDGRDYELSDPVLERLVADTEPIFSSERDNRPTDRCEPWFQEEP